MKSILNHTLIKFFARNKQYVLALFLMAAILTILYLVSSGSSDQLVNPVVPPVVSKTDLLEVVRVNPVGDTRSLDTFYPIAVEFNRSLTDNVSSVGISVTPSIQLKKYTLSSTPNTLWLEPVTVPNKEIRGWEDGVEYTITILKGFKSADGSTLENNYMFKFRNAAQDVYMIAE